VGSSIQPLSTRAQRRSLALLITLLLIALTVVHTRAATPAVEVLYGPAWVPGDTIKDGAAELEVLICVARVQNTNPLSGLVSVGQRNGGFPPAAETALERVAHMGVPVVRLAQNGPVSSHPGDAFIEAGSLSPAEAKRLLTDCLARFGALPAAANPSKPTKKESAALQARLALFQAQFDARNLNLLAMR
jgi:L-asparaginase